MDTLEKILINYLRDNKGWHRKVDLYLVASNEEYSPETCGRTLRTLSEEGKIHVEYYKGRKRGTKLAKYCYDKPEIKKPVLEYKNGVLTAIL